MKKISYPSKFNDYSSGEIDMTYKWEYLVDLPFASINTHPDKECRVNGETPRGNIEAYFNKLGEQGWELCGIDEHGYYFKRRTIELHEEEIE